MATDRLTKKTIPDILIVPRLKSKKLADSPQLVLGRRASGALKATPSTKATVRLGVRNEATIPMAIMLKPTKK